MRYYFKLQKIRIERIILDFGLKPWLAIILAILGLALLSFVLYTRTSFAGLILGLFGLSSCLSLSEKQRNEFLTKTFSKKDYRNIRFVENTAIILPFIISMLVLGSYAESLIILILSLSITMIKYRGVQGKARLHLFSKFPFEYTSGVRQWGIVFLIALVLIGIGIYVNNFELSLFALAIIPLVSLGFYSKPEPFYFVWNSNRTSEQFLLRKIKIALIYNTMICLPIIITLTIYEPSKILFILAVFLVGCLMLTAMILGKYTAYPLEISVPQGMVMGLCFIIFPLLIFLIPYLWKKANGQLSLQL